MGCEAQLVETPNRREKVGGIVQGIFLGMKIVRKRTGNVQMGEMFRYGNCPGNVLITMQD